jgi:acetyltransferase-like isoleucine patch superfamily enzyme
MISALLKKIFYVLNDAYTRRRLMSNRNILCGMDLKTAGVPMVKLSTHAKIILGNNVTLNSRNDGYHANMHSPVKLYADKNNALIRIGHNTRINGACLHAHSMIEIGDNCLIAANVQIMDGNGHEVCFENPTNRINTSSKAKNIYIEDNVWIGLNSIILPGVRIGQGSIIAANTVVTKDVPPMVIFAGNPGKIVKMSK